MSTKSDIDKMIKQLEAMRDTVEGDFIDIGNEAVDLIKKRTRLGYGVSEHGKPKQRLEKLSDPYKEARKRDKPKGPTTPAKSNLTHSGDMLEALEATEKAGNKIDIGFNTRKEEEKAEWVSDDRPFNNLSKAEIKQLNQSLAKSVTKSIKKND